MGLTSVHVGLDDTDSPLGLCTTFVALAIVREASRIGAGFADLPYLVRLNPNVPLKTRGNGAVAIHFLVEEELVPRVEEAVVRALDDLSERHGKTDPAAILVKGDVPRAFRSVYLRALTEFIPSSYVRSVLERFKGESVKLLYSRSKRPRGLVGAVASLGAYPLEDYTYELIVYRSPEERSESRDISEDLLLELDRKYRPLVFATYDYSSRRVLAVPHGPDPVIFGLRSLDPEILVNVAVDVLEKISHAGYLLFKTNQGTSAHLQRYKPVALVRPYDSVVVRGSVAEKPTVISGGHVIVNVCDETGCLQIAFYKETGRLNRVAKLLSRGDLVEVGGGVMKKDGLVLNAEYLRLIKPALNVKRLNPLCPKCGSRMTSAGKGKGYKCPKCGYRAKEAAKIYRVAPRTLEPGTYFQSPSAYRHLTKPPEILGLRPVDATKVLLSGMWFM
ncbi:tRNA(Ile)(2)-agmatinylcytidine synthase [Thermofilum pendens]|uniref:tRNA(Ile2) 2-agmatinylcytidine synthetase TiaS n=1 Tax=Thermofilum pendens (strain DSM 2475 / Hrk 5) TaxID=368408 RepID=TIAS_THEPD|nr:tRNA(Ile)(2)-agmatinylcytidine synthase [Thermofilum pendens]A1RXS9.1 RecName: Full=tRNA(Ile2) 2-agmatinylcytidine synthetase TiaS; Short=tRNA(Ile2)-agm2C synthetase; AltName: Full=tRNA(Ile2) agmatidine synthetase [Thermofilum pendens Hrk 5]ABL78009.1 domain of unknown function DUF1743 [Thermofilum pendens Hrk 5]